MVPKDVDSVLLSLLPGAGGRSLGRCSWANKGGHFVLLLRVLPTVASCGRWAEGKEPEPAFGMNASGESY